MYALVENTAQFLVSFNNGNFTKSLVPRRISSRKTGRTSTDYNKFVAHNYSTSDFVLDVRMKLPSLS